MEILFTGDNRNDKIKLEFAQLRIGEILLQNDLSNGVHFHFGDSSLFWSYVKSIQVLRMEDAKTYMSLDNNIWFYNFRRHTNRVNVDGITRIKPALDSSK